MISQSEKTAPEVVNPSHEVDTHPITLEHGPEKDSIVQTAIPDAPHDEIIKERWNYPRHNIFRLTSVYIAFLNFGLNDASFGALLPEFQSYYDLSYTVVSLVFLAAFVGYGVAAIASDPLHHWVGQRGAAFLIPTCRIICYIVLICHVPWAGIIVSVVVAGLGNGITEGAWNSWIGGMQSSSELLGFLHGLYGLGGLLSPLIATAMVQNYAQPWWNFYYILLVTNVLELVLGVAAFWTSTGAHHRAKLAKEVGGTEGGRIKDALSHKVTWMVSLFLFIYVGAEVSLGGWITTFMLEVRGGTLFTSGVVTTGFWAGLTAGRMILGFVTPKIGERIAVLGYLVICIVLQLLFWLIPSFTVSAIMIALEGFFIGPMFPSTVVVATKLLPTRLHVTAIGFSSAIGGGGAAVLPFAIGAIASARGVQILQPIVVAFLGVLLLVWLLFPRQTQTSTKTTIERPIEQRAE